MLRVTRFLMTRSVRTLQQRRDDMAIKRQQESFKKFVSELALKDDYTLLDYKREILANIKTASSSWLKAFRQADPEEADLEKHRRLICAFKEEELLDDSLVNSAVKIQVAQVTGYEPDEVNRLIRLYKLNHHLHLYLKQRRVKGEPLPENEEDIRFMLRADEPPEGISKPKRTKTKWSKQQLKTLHT